MEVTEADDVAVGFDGVEDAVGPGEGLKEAVHSEVFVYPEGVEGGCVKAGEKHVYDDQ